LYFTVKLIQQQSICHYMKLKIKDKIHNNTVLKYVFVKKLMCDLVHIYLTIKCSVQL